MNATKYYLRHATMTFISIFVLASCQQRTIKYSKHGGNDTLSGTANQGNTLGSLSPTKVSTSFTFPYNLNTLKSDGNSIYNPILALANQDTDGDTIPDSTDNCPFSSNVDQADVNNNGRGDQCEITDSTATGSDG